ncbi:hypothetical protein LEP1GSC170_0258, partial [Leptospira interrogans serovar Bataviae str. HAI135]
MGTACPQVDPSALRPLNNPNQMLPGGELMRDLACNNLPDRVVIISEDVHSY